MSTRVLKWLAVVLPVFFSIIVLDIQNTFLKSLPHAQAELVTTLMMLLGAVAFSTWIFRVVSRRETELKHSLEQLAALHEAELALTTELELDVVLQKVVDIARQLIGARYGFLGVLDEEQKQIARFVTSGIAPETRKLINSQPEGRGLIGEMIRDGKAIRIDHIAGNPLAAGFPPEHPLMRTLLGIPIRFKKRVICNLYLADKLWPFENEDTDPVFTEQDQQLLEMFATQAAIAIENAQLYRQTQQLAVLEERERFGRDLHDGVIQAIYAVGLQLESVQHVMKDDLRQANDIIKQAIHGLNDAIHDIRNYILDLRPERFQGRNLQSGLLELSRDLRANSFLEIQLSIDENEADVLNPEQTVEVLHITQEALTNVRKHARAHHVWLTVSSFDGFLSIDVVDDGVGIAKNPVRVGGHGLLNMQQRAANLGGELEVMPGSQGGTLLRLAVPLEKHD